VKKTTSDARVVTFSRFPMFTGRERSRRSRSEGREKRGVPAIPVVMFGGEVDEEAAEAAGERGAHAFIKKPFDPEQLIASSKQLPSA
jgi:CheY-like chemotaxis protein